MAVPVAQEFHRRDQKAYDKSARFRRRLLGRIPLQKLQLFVSDPILTLFQDDSTEVVELHFLRQHANISSGQLAQFFEFRVSKGGLRWPTPPEHIHFLDATVT